jgi:hypothetical protein
VRLAAKKNCRESNVAFMVVDTTEEPNGDPVCMEKRIFIFT